MYCKILYFKKIGQAHKKKKFNFELYMLKKPLWSFTKQYINNQYNLCNQQIVIKKSILSLNKEQKMLTVSKYNFGKFNSISTLFFQVN